MYDIPLHGVLRDAIDQVSAWDLPEEDFAEAVNAQMHLMLGGVLEHRDPYVAIAVDAHQ